MFTRNVPIFLVFAAALVIGIGAIVVALARNNDSEPVPTLNDFKAAQSAKSTYYNSDFTVSAATCTATSWDSATDVWQVECTMDRGGGKIETTEWAVPATGKATRTDTGTGSATPAASASPAVGRSPAAAS